MIAPPRRVLVTGAAGAIGSAIAREMRTRWPDARFVLLDREAASMAELARELGAATAHAADLRELDALPRLVEALEADGPLDGLVNCAGIMRVQGVATWQWDDARDLLAVDLLAPLRLQDLVVRGMVERGRGVIVNVASMAGKIPLQGLHVLRRREGRPRMASEIARAELAPHGVRVVTVYPGPVRSALEQGARADYGGGGWFGRLAPTGEPAELARRIMRAVERDEPRVIYPRVYGVGWPRADAGELVRAVVRAAAGRVAAPARLPNEPGGCYRSRTRSVKRRSSAIPADLLVERPRADPRHLAPRVRRGHVDQAREEQRLAEAAAAVRRPGAGRAEPAEAAVVAVVRRERAVGAVPAGDVDAGRRVVQRAGELERPGAAELGRGRAEERVLAGACAADLVAAGAGAVGQLGGAAGRDARVVADVDEHVAPRLAVAPPAAALEPADRLGVALVDARREVVPRLVERAQPGRAGRACGGAARVEQRGAGAAAAGGRIHREHADPSAATAATPTSASPSHAPNARGGPGGPSPNSFSSATAAARSYGHAAASTRSAAASRDRSSAPTSTPRP